MNPLAVPAPCPYYCPRHSHPLTLSTMEDVFYCERCEAEKIIGPFRGFGLWMIGEVLHEPRR